jgi:hypothetical protein
MKSKYILAMSILLLLSGLCSAATPVNIDDFVGTTWGVYGKTKVSVSKAGSQSAEGVGYVNFSDDGTSFSVMDAADYTMNGTYEVDSGKLVVNVGVDDVQNFFDDYVQQALDDSGLSDYIDDWAVNVTSAKSTCKVTYSGSVVSLAITISSKAGFTLDYEDKNGNPKTFHGNASFTINMSGDHPVAGGEAKWASKWNINAMAGLTAKKIKVSMPVPIELSLGDADSGLGLNQYSFVNTDGVLFSSAIQHDFCRQKNKIILGSDGSGDEITSIIDKLVAANSSDSYDYIDISSGPITATVKNGNTITLKVTVKFEESFYDEDKDKDVVVNRGTLTLTGTGVPEP